MMDLLQRAAFVQVDLVAETRDLLWAVNGDVRQIGLEVDGIVGSRVAETSRYDLPGDMEIERDDRLAGLFD